MANKNKLSIYLIKDEFAADDTKILKSDVMNSVHFGKADLEELGIMAADPHLCHTHFAPCGFYAEGHMLEVVIIEKDTLEVIDDDIDSSV